MSEHEKIGRPLRAEAPGLPVAFRLSPEERHEAEAAATVNHQTLSDFCRDAVVTATAECVEQPSDLPPPICPCGHG